MARRNSDSCHDPRYGVLTRSWTTIQTFVVRFDAAREPAEFFAPAIHRAAHPRLASESGPTSSQCAIA